MNAKFFDVKKAKQDAIINAALKIFTESGYKKASTDVIVKEAGISKGLLFHYFISKQGVYEFIYDYSVKYMTLELTRAVNKSEKDFFKVQIQVERAKTRVMKNYPYMQLFLNNAKFETDPDAVAAMGDNRGAFEETINAIYSQTDNTQFMDKLDINRVINMINWMSDGFIRDNLLSGSCSLDDMNEEFEKCLNMLRRHFYRAPGEDMISIAREEMVERDDTIMDQLKLDATFEERLQAGRSGSFGVEAEEEQETEEAPEENNEEIKESQDEDYSQDVKAVSEDVADGETSKEEQVKTEAESENDEEVKTDSEDDKVAEDSEDATENSEDKADEEANAEKTQDTDEEPVEKEDVSLPSWWTQGPSELTPVMSEIPVPADILHTTLREETEESKEEEDEPWAPRPVKQIRL